LPSKQKKQTPPPFFEKFGSDLQKLRNYIETLLAKWRPLLGLDQWDIGVDYHADGCARSPGVLADASVDWKYKHGHINFYLPKLLEEKPDQVEYIVLHELMHFMVNQMRGGKRRRKDAPNEERVVTELGRAFLRAHAKR
jgi:hypothetical protein